MASANGTSTAVGNFSPRGHALLDFQPHFCERNVPVRKQSVYSFGVAQKAKQQMRGIDCLSTELAQLVSSKEEGSTRTFRIAVKHVMTNRSRCGWRTRANLPLCDPHHSANS